MTTVVTGLEKQIAKKPGIFFTARPTTLVEESSFQLIKNLVLNEEYRQSFNQENLPIELRSSFAIVNTVRCLAELFPYEELQNIEEGDILSLAFNKSYVDNLKSDIAGYKEQLLSTSTQEKKEELECDIKLYSDELNYLFCVKENLELIINNAQLAYLFLLTLNEVTIASLFENNQVVIKDMVNSFIDLLVIKEKIAILKSLLTHNELTKLLLEQLLKIYLIDSKYIELTDHYSEEIINHEFVTSLHNLLIEFFTTIPDEQLTANNNELGHFIMTQLLNEIPFINDDYKEILDSLFKRNLTPNIMFLQGSLKIPYAYWLFEFFNNDPDFINNRIDEIIYFIEHGLSIDMLELPIEANDDNTVRRAKNNYARLRQERPEVIKKFESAQQEYRQKRIRENKRESSL